MRNLVATIVAMEKQ